MEEYEDDCIWIWGSFAPRYRMILAHVVGERKQYVADKIVNATADNLSSLPLFTSDGLKFYADALLKRFGKVVSFPRTGDRGRPMVPKLVPDDELRYAHIIKHRQGGRLKKVVKKIIFGNGIDTRDISTSLMERQNLTFRQDVNRISRKTLGFSEKTEWLDKTMMLYFMHFDFCRGHGSLTYLLNFCVSHRL